MRKFSVIISLILLIIFSCKEEYFEKDEDLVTARKWFNTYRSSIQNEPSSQDQFSTASIVKEVFWERAVRLQGEGLPDGFAVPVWYEEKYRFGSQTIRELWVFKTDKGGWQAQIVEVLATNENFRRNGYKLDMRNFSGGITIHNWKTGFQVGLFFEDGVRVGYISEYTIMNAIPNVHEPPKQLITEDCGYQYSYVSNGELYVVWVRQDCMTYWWTIYSQSLAAWSAQAWVDAQYGCEVSSSCQNWDTNASPYYEPIDYDQIARDNFNYNKIDDTKLKPCMQNVLSNLQCLANGSVASIIQKFSGSIPGYNWEMKDGVIRGGQNAQTSQSYNKSTGTVTTIFDATKLTNASDLSVARTILHESIHAYLVAYFKVDPINAAKTYSDLVKDYAQQLYGGNSNSLQHAEFVRNFVNDIALALNEFGTNQGYVLPFRFYQDLAWGGLTQQVSGTGVVSDTPWFLLSFPNVADRDRINNVITIELTKKDINGNPQPPKGATAGC